MKDLSKSYYNFNMKNITIAIFISLIIHFAFFYSYKTPKQIELKEPQIKPSSKLTYVKLAPAQKSVESVEQFIEPKKEHFITPPEPLPIPEKKTPKKAIPIEKPKPQTKPVTEEKFIEVKEQPSKSSLESALTKEEKAIDDITKSYLALYGDDFLNFNEETKEFLKDNLSTIGKITQQYLIYPSISIRTKQQGYNVVEFMLHPNGDITDLKLIQSSSYSALDNNSIHTIKVAHKDYPKPKEITKVRIFVYYKLY
ncbi:energy transducer TonB [Arcobacter sp. FWKO B]|nr:energy transducer TonB [Arcobacter sp. FWKO B]